MVEFDVQVSKDLIPCIYHEFEICVVTKTKENKEVMLEVPVKDLRLEELQGLRSHHPTERERGVKSFETEGLPEHESFPTLSHVLDDLDPSCGANIEVKYGQTMKDGKEETQSQLEMNLFVDQVKKRLDEENKYLVLFSCSDLEDGYEREWRQEGCLLLIQPGHLHHVSITCMIMHDNA